MIRAPTVPADANWRVAGNCSGLGDDTMFPQPADAAGIAYAKSICAGCPVARECLVYADALDERDGIWAGLTAAERGRPKKWPSVVIAARSRAARVGVGV